MLRTFIACIAMSCVGNLFAGEEQDDLKFDFQDGQTARFTLQLGEKAGVSRFEIQTGAGEKACALELLPDREGVVLTSRLFQWDDTAGKWIAAGDERLVFWPPAKTAGSMAAALANIPARSWRNRPLDGRLRFEDGAVQLWMEGRLILNRSLPSGEGGNVTLNPGPDTAAMSRGITSEAGLIVPAEISHLLDGGGSEPKTVEVDGVRFNLRDGASLSLAEAGWPEWRDDPGSFYEDYDAGPWFIGDRRIPLIQVPREDYVAAYLLAYADDDPKTGNQVTLRAGRRLAGSGNQSQVAMMDFSGIVPREKSGEAKELKVVRIPFTEAFAQDIEGDVIDIEITRELRLARRSPDPCRFRWRPLGLPSGVHIAAISLERSPLQLEVKAEAEGSLFEAPEPPRFTVRLANISAKEQTFRLEALVDGKPVKTLEGAVAAGETAERQIGLPAMPPGHYSLEIGVSNGTGKLFSRHAMFGCLPPDTRKHREESPLGTWQFGGQHFTPPRDDRETAELHRKLGLRYGLFSATPEMRREFGVLRGNEYAVRGRASGEEALAGYEKVLKAAPDTLPTVLLFHEDSISGPHVTRAPDLFHDRPPYQLDEKEKARFDEMVRTATEAVKAIRAKHPEVKFSLGNGPLPLREEFYRNGFPADLFDMAGNEAGSFGRPPETQPPDIVANNAGLWMDRQLLDAYGYADKPVYQCYEITYPGTNPGNLSYQTQADYFVRHILHSMAWRIPRIRMGCIVDTGNSYYFSNWGSSGFFTARPRIEPKPAAVAVATLSAVLDGATYEGFIETGSESAYLLRFRKKDGSFVLPHWVVRGTRNFQVKLEGNIPPALRLISGNGAASEVKVSDGLATFGVTPTPGYLELPAGVTVADVSLGKPEHLAKPAGTVSELDPLSRLEGWEVVKKRNPTLEAYNPMTPRRMGNFSFEPVEKFEGEGPALRVTPHPLKTGKASMPMVMELRHLKGIELPGKPSEIGLRVNGNSAWGRVIFELEDASGQKWTSIGAKAAEHSSWMADWLPEEAQADYKPGEIADWNTDDQWGLSRINFDGWRYVGFPLPGQYPGEGYHWPANSQWKWSGDGVVHYPLRLTKVIVELPEKTLYLDRYAPAKRPEIYLRDLVSVENAEVDQPKNAPGGYAGKYQNDMR